VPGQTIGCCSHPTWESDDAPVLPPQASIRARWESDDVLSKPARGCGRHKWESDDVQWGLLGTSGLNTLRGRPPQDVSSRWESDDVPPKGPSGSQMTCQDRPSDVARIPSGSQMTRLYSRGSPPSGQGGSQMTCFPSPLEATGAPCGSQMTRLYSRGSPPSGQDGSQKTCSHSHFGQIRSRRWESEDVHRESEDVPTHLRVAGRRPTLADGFEGPRAYRTST
jgi:hypothetical protein